MLEFWALPYLDTIILFRYNVVPFDTIYISGQFTLNFTVKDFPDISMIIILISVLHILFMNKPVFAIQLFVSQFI